jgi:hypothetical protein
LAFRQSADALQHTGNSEALDLSEYGDEILVTGAEVALRVGKCNRVDAGQPVIFVVNQAAVADQRPQLTAEHEFVVPKAARTALI